MTASLDGPANPVPANPVFVRVPSWATRSDDPAAPAVRAGAALAVLDGLATAAAPHAGAWAGRLAVAAAARALAWSGRPEDDATVRDLIAFGDLRGPAGPAGPAVRAWHWLSDLSPADLSPAGRWAEMPGLLAGLGVRSGTDAADLAAVLTGAAAAACPLAAVARAIRAADASRPGRPALALWAADAVLARWLGWPHGLPLVTLGLGRRLRAEAGEPELADAVVRGAVLALNRFAGLGRCAAALQAVRPRLRAKAAGPVIERLLARDALPVAGVRDLIPERAARRLFDRLVELGVVRELTGRTTARLYGL